MTLVARVTAQAKVNLLLHVLAREAGGYHAVETVFQRIELGDEVTVRVSSGRSIDCQGPAVPSGGFGPAEKNLAYRAALVYAEATGWPPGFAIEIDKRIPVGGGLGGGSADAGAVLRSLDAVAPNPLGERLIEIATPLGADVPFLTVESPTALGWGRGERIFPIHALASRPVALAVPEFSIATAEAYAWLSADRGSYRPVARLLTPDSLATWEAIVSVAENDFERVVARRHPVIDELVDELASADALVAMMSGSGSSVFGVFAQAPDAAGLARASGATIIPTRTSDRVVRVEVER